jgi:acyl carrier protein
MKAENRARLEEIFRIVLDVPPEQDVTTIRRTTCRRWDSLTLVTMVAAIESEFGLRLDPSHAPRFTSFASVELLLEEMGL